MTIELWWHEFRRVGWPALVAPPGALAVGLVAGLANDRLVLICLEALLPLAFAVVAVTVVARDGCRELHLSLPRDHRATLGRRLLGLFGWTASTATLYAVVAATRDIWPFRSAVLVWLPPLLALTGLALVTLLVSRSVVVATSVLAGVWLAELLFTAQLPWPFLLLQATYAGTGGHWTANRLTLTGTGLALLAVAALLTRRPTRLLTEEDM